MAFMLALSIIKRNLHRDFFIIFVKAFFQNVFYILKWLLNTWIKKTKKISHIRCAILKISKVSHGKKKRLVIFFIRYILSCTYITEIII